MFKTLFSLTDRIKKNYSIFQNIIHLRKIKPKFLFYSENKNYQMFSYLLIEALVKKYPKEVYYVSSYTDDKIKNLDVKNIFIGRGFLMNVFFFNYKSSKPFFNFN